ncbi:hypothetical protein E2C01_016318 [Portunus trituberculatus]|uniref:Uncharacterized protein n=2 Tax=Portunus trituberculatus TaxID=210409 RepID=A0A5B7DQ93_PORTR|nr:hypothetical protein [Portunus trituberculatus]
MLRRVIAAAGPPLPPPRSLPQSPHPVHNTHIPSPTSPLHACFPSPPTHILTEETREEKNREEETRLVSQLAAEDLFRNVTVAPGVTLFHMYHQTP